MTQDNEMLIYDLIEAGADEVLSEIRNGYTKHLPIELLHIEDREICEAIDHYFAAKKKIFELVIETAQMTNSENIDFEYDIYSVSAKTDNISIYEPAGEYTPAINEISVEIKQLNISISC
jgi:hypothetical protein